MTTEFKRPDGRKINELRKITAKVGVVPNADGSALFAFGGTIAIAAVYGPKQMHPQHSQNPSSFLILASFGIFLLLFAIRILHSSM